MKPKVVAYNVTSKSIFRPSFINQLQYKIMRVVEKESKDMKFKLVLIPEDYNPGDEPVEHKNFTEYIQEYLNEPKQMKKLKSFIRLYRIPPKCIMKEVMPDELEKT